jgi:hypothetical protein
MSFDAPSGALETDETRGELWMLLLMGQSGPTALFEQGGEDRGRARGGASFVGPSGVWPPLDLRDREPVIACRRPPGLWSR